MSVRNNRIGVLPAARPPTSAPQVGSSTPSAEMEAVMARQAAELSKSKTRRGKTLASKGKKYKGKGSSSDALRTEVRPPPTAEVSHPSPVIENKELEVVEIDQALSRKRAAPPKNSSDSAKKGKAAVTDEAAVWRPDWILTETSSALGNERLCAEFLCHSILPCDAEKMAAKEDFALLKDTATSFYQVRLWLDDLFMTPVLM
jgi:hypothetical protein